MNPRVEKLAKVLAELNNAPFLMTKSGVSPAGRIATKVMVTLTTTDLIEEAIERGGLEQRAWECMRKGELPALHEHFIDYDPRYQENGDHLRIGHQPLYRRTDQETPSE